MTGGLLDAGALGDVLIATINDRVPGDILDKYSKARRDVFINVVDPATQANLRRLYENDPDTVGDTDPSFEASRKRAIRIDRQFAGFRHYA